MVLTTSPLANSSLKDEQIEMQGTYVLTHYHMHLYHETKNDGT